MMKNIWDKKNYQCIYNVSAAPACPRPLFELIIKLGGNKNIKTKIIEEDPNFMRKKKINLATVLRTTVTAPNIAFMVVA